MGWATSYDCLTRVELCTHQLAREECQHLLCRGVSINAKQVADRCNSAITPKLYIDFSLAWVSLWRRIRGL